MGLSPLHAPLRHAQALAVGDTITLDVEHVRGLRLREINPKEAFSIADRDGRFFRASLTTLGVDAGQAQIYECMQTSPESPLELTLFCAVLARQRMLGVIQKATELGVMRVVPVLTAHSVPLAGLAHEKAHAWPAQALRAARQCRRSSLPDIRSALPLTEALDDAGFRQADARFVLDDRSAADSPALSSLGKPSKLALLVGPEGGFSDDERRLLDTRGTTPLRLGGRVLRAETAALVGLALLQHAFGDLR